MKRLFLAALFACIAQFSFAGLLVTNTTGSTVNIAVFSWNGYNCGSYVAEGTFSIPPGPPANIPLTEAVGMRILLLNGAFVVVARETEPSIDPACEDIDDTGNHIVWMGSLHVTIQ